MNEMMGLSPLQLYEAEFLANRPTVPMLEKAKAERIRIAALAEQVKATAAENAAEMARLREAAEQLNREIGGQHE